MFDALPDWQQLSLYAMAAALLLTLLPRLPYVGQALHAMLSFGVLAICIFFLLQQAPYQPWLAPLLDRVGADSQTVSGDEVRLRMSPDGHFWAEVTLNGVETRMLVDSGATLTTLSVETAERAGLRPTPGLAPIFARTGNGVVQASPATVETLQLGALTATDLKVAISPSLGPVDILGMNVLVRLASWRVEGQTMILTPRPATDSEAAPA
ncbi:TIGR02281 family clan AA aspartic protease [Phenylobacterium sp.]|jgi:aspartyl protease family protein|uniref:retropepsin-like aspartic protease family protein n=1 Tax=Phenylobacterium sp. TaxID=1871053 RepID=UPI000C8D64E6|nr:retropepsin-like aspartic protease [Phenylobacterium sp.]MAK81918.1 TIGR02281 family clan AA aspartic protease [Phenylobacterium sp.]|tara:strand:- start:21523 stop:22152 length:630 start_codon:yes stop_codon:yes gene_type:complete